MKISFHHIALFAALFTSSWLQAQKRFRSEIFPDIDSAVNITYGEATNLKGVREVLQLDVFTPKGPDTMKHRPLLIFIHGGGFQNGNRKITLGRRICTGFAQKGYVTASISYRLGIGEGKSPREYAEAMYRAQQDGRAAVRFFRKHAEEYGIDTAQIFISGTSAGSMTCLAMAYMDEHEAPAAIDRSTWGSLEGNSGNAGYSSRVQGVINCWGALPDYRWIRGGDAPLYNTGGTADKTVPYDSSYDYHGFKDGPSILYEHCLRQGIPTGLRPFEGAGHTLDSDRKKLDSCLAGISDWLYARLRVHGPPSQGVSRWQKEIAAFDSLNEVETHRPGSVIFLGSSYIRMWKNIRTDLGQPNVIHRGFGGCNMSDVAYYIKRIVYPHQPKAIFIYVGNDIVAGERDKSPEQVLELFKFTVKTIREKFPSIPVTWLQISPSEKRWTAWDRISEANEMIRQYCISQPNLHYISFAEHFLGTDGTPLKSLYLPDKLHYNEEGYKVWGKAIRSEVKRIAGR